MGEAILPWQRADFTGGEVGHQEEKEGVGGDMKIEINEAVYQKANTPHQSR